MGIVNELKRRSARELVPPVHIAMAYAGLGDATQGIEWLNQGIDQRDISIPENVFDPLLDPLRSDPGFKQVSKRMGCRTGGRADGGTKAIPQVAILDHITCPGRGICDTCSAPH